MDRTAHLIDEQPAQAKENTVSIVSSIESGITTVEKDINIAEVWVTDIAAKVAGFVTKAEALEPAVATALSSLVTKLQAFLAASTPAVVGEGLNFPADSVAYTSFEALVAEFQSVAKLIASTVKAAV
jgi:hypothetical protein